MSRVVSWFARRTKLQLGVLWLVVTLLAGSVLMNKQNLLLSMRRGDTITAEFSSRYKLAPVVSKVEVAGVKVGQITAVSELDGGGSAVEMKLDPGTLDALGSKPRAAIRPATFLGGPGLSAYVELTPGGDTGRLESGRIPKDRTQVPVEFDRVNEILQDTAREGLQTTVAGFDAALANGGKEALGSVLTDAPPALAPTGRVLDALGGSRGRGLAPPGRAALPGGGRPDRDRRRDRIGGRRPRHLGLHAGRPGPRAGTFDGHHAGHAAGGPGRPGRPRRHPDPARRPPPAPGPRSPGSTSCSASSRPSCGRPRRSSPTSGRWSPT